MASGSRDRSPESSLLVENSDEGHNVLVSNLQSVRSVDTSGAYRIPVSSLLNDPIDQIQPVNIETRSAAFVYGDPPEHLNGPESIIYPGHEPFTNGSMQLNMLLEGHATSPRANRDANVETLWFSNGADVSPDPSLGHELSPVPQLPIKRTRPPIFRPPRPSTTPSTSSSAIRSTSSFIKIKPGIEDEVQSVETTHAPSKHPVSSVQNHLDLDPSLPDGLPLIQPRPSIDSPFIKIEPGIEDEQSEERGRRAASYHPVSPVLQFEDCDVKPPPSRPASSSLLSSGTHHQPTYSKGYSSGWIRSSSRNGVLEGNQRESQSGDNWYQFGNSRYQREDHGRKVEHARNQRDYYNQHVNYQATNHWQADHQYDGLPRNSDQH